MASWASAPVDATDPTGIAAEDRAEPMLRFGEA
jgi:hypothetical protein